MCTLAIIFFFCNDVAFQQIFVRFTRTFKGLISPPSEPPGEMMSFGVSPVNYSDSDSEQPSLYINTCMTRSVSFPSKTFLILHLVSLRMESQCFLSFGNYLSGHLNTMKTATRRTSEALPGVLGIQGEGLFIFRDLGRRDIYFQGFGEFLEF